MAWPFIFILVLGIAAFGVNASSFLTPLATYVKSRSDPHVPPIQDGHAVKVHFSFASLNIADVDEEHNIVTTEGIVSSQWRTGIVWEPAKYGGVEKITLPQKYIWTPILQAIDTAEEMEDLSPHLIVLSSNGTAYGNAVYRKTGLCDVTNVHNGATCKSEIVVWGYSKDQVTIHNIRVDKTGFYPFFAGSKYEIIDDNVNKKDFLFDGKTYQIIASTFTVKKKSRQRNYGPFRAFFQWH